MGEAFFSGAVLRPSMKKVVATRAHWKDGWMNACSCENLTGPSPGNAKGFSVSKKVSSEDGKNAIGQIRLEIET